MTSKKKLRRALRQTTARVGEAEEEARRMRVQVKSCSFQIETLENRLVTAHREAQTAHEQVRQLRREAVRLDAENAKLAKIIQRLSPMNTGSEAQAREEADR